MRQETLNPHNNLLIANVKQRVGGREKTADDFRRAIEAEKRLFSSHNVPTLPEAIRSVEIGFQHDVKPLFACHPVKGKPR